METCYYQCGQPLEQGYTWTQEGQTCTAHTGCWKDSRNHLFTVFHKNGKITLEHLQTDANARKLCIDIGATAALRNNKGALVPVYP